MAVKHSVQFNPRIYWFIFAGAALVAGIFFVMHPLGSDAINGILPGPGAAPLASSSTAPLPQRQQKILYTVPFVAQAPFGTEWSNPVFQNACEEVSVLMAMKWVQGKKSIDRQEAVDEVLKMAVFEKKKYGHYIDTSATTTAQFIKDYFKHTKVQARSNITTADIANELYVGNLVIVPVNGQKIGNPNYKPPGPLQHVIVIIGYDPRRNIFYTNDPGTRRGKSYTYTAAALERSLQDYPTGEHLPIRKTEKRMIVIGR